MKPSYRHMAEQRKPLPPEVLADAHDPPPREPDLVIRAEPIERRRPTMTDASIHPTASIDAGASIDACARIGEYARIDAGANIGAYARIGACASIDACARIGANARIGAGARIGANARIGEYASIGANARIGEYASIGAGARIDANTTWDVSPYYTICGRWPAYDVGGGKFGIGCLLHPIEHWIAHLDEIASEHGATDLERELGRAALHMVCLLRGIEVPT